MPAGEDWRRLIRPWFGKDHAARLLERFLAGRPRAAWLCPPSCTGRVAESMEALEHLLSAWRAEGHGRFVAKSLFGAAGGNMVRLWEPEISDRQRRWITKRLQVEGSLLVEPWLDRVLDFSAHYDVDAEGVQFVGWTRMRTDLRGQYAGSVCGASFTSSLSPELARFAHDGAADRLRNLYLELGKFLAPGLREAGFQGALGVDALVGRVPEAPDLRLKPIVEINPRHTMGRLALELKRRMAPGRTGRLEMHAATEIRRREGQSLSDWAEAVTRRHPARVDDRGRMVSGTVCLNDPETAEHALATWSVHPNQSQGRPQETT